MTTVISTQRLRKQAGYTLLMVVFMVATMLIIAAAAAPNILTEGRRDKEEELIWRGRQYARAIGLYYRKFGKYPTKVEDLTKQTNGVRFLRQAYTDPMNKEDGSWRFLYAGPNGQLIGSLRPIGLGLPGGGIPGASPFGGGMQPPPAPGATPGAGAPGQQGNLTQTGSLMDSQPQSLTGDVLGGNIVGVGSKVKTPSIRIYMGGDTYQLWEFVWTPTGQLPFNTISPYTGAPGVTNPSQPAPQQNQQTTPPPQTPPAQ